MHHQSMRQICSSMRVVCLVTENKLGISKQLKFFLWKCVIFASDLYVNVKVKTIDSTWIVHTKYYIYKRSVRSTVYIMSCLSILVKCQLCTFWRLVYSLIILQPGYMLIIAVNKVSNNVLGLIKSYALCVHTGIP